MYPGVQVLRLELNIIITVIGGIEKCLDNTAFELINGWISPLICS